MNTKKEPHFEALDVNGAGNGLLLEIIKTLHKIVISSEFENIEYCFDNLKHVA